ncbi:nitrogenase iron-molybdenum cofactor biosynthesis protein NifN [Magnetospirillum sulfuroxidans]|uniref:Nitrogenase iron-molybdenum cofactor biosynthesis protein NifN n=1 Tax=Magnetospirillum sulfuroxidans TaxID=611300 RepID=A0ABS5IGA2_9PROT|nr:nitrogenase iron-molybdenum cofactor biosynthesis protein NifN [Magnetospirillum sulfuroxidans]MBR9973445.1 nitrogenase iron-molybdenum cofactor biosynthesis protein NifN [Magnetospirillum sulfuroxidans]
MAEIVLPTKALAVNPLKTSQPIGASLAFLGLARAMPLEHGARGCTSFNKLFFMRHFDDPIALQTTAMDQVTTIIGADDNVVEALATICAKDLPEVIGLITTGLSEMQGADVPRTVAAFRAAHPEFSEVAVVPVSASDTLGCLETGYALAVEALLRTLVPTSRDNVTRVRQVNVLVPAMMTPGDVESLRDWITAFDLHPIMVPDIADSLDGHLIDEGFSTLTYGGALKADLETMHQSQATLVVGRSLDRAADLLREKTGVADFRFAGLMGLEACDAFSSTLCDIAGIAMPPTILRQRSQLMDAMVDCQFQLGGARVAIAADADHLAALTRFLHGMGAEVAAAVASARAGHLAELPVESVVVGDLEDLEWLARDKAAELIVANSHGAEAARRLGCAHLRAGFPIYDSYGDHAKAWIGYGGTRRALFETANLLAGHYQEIRPYRSRYWQGTARDKETNPC